MRKLMVITTGLLISIGLLGAAGCFAQEQPAIPQAQTPAIQPDVQNAAPQQKENQTIIVPPGTKIPVTLTTAIRAKSTRHGDTIRAVTAFPVTIGTQLAIPAGTFVEGTFDKLPKRNAAGQPVIHFARLVFSNGYSVNIVAETLAARAGAADDNFAVASIPEEYHVGGPWSDFQQAPGSTQPPLPKPNIGAAVGIGAAAIVGAVVVAAVLFHHRGGYDAVVYDVGSQFDIVLENPLALDSARVAAAIAATPNQ